MNKAWPLALGAWGPSEYYYSFGFAQEVALVTSERGLICPGPYSQEMAGRGLRRKFSHTRSYGVSSLQTSSALDSFQVKLLVFISLHIYVETSLLSDLGSNPTLPLNSCLG